MTDSTQSSSSRNDSEKLTWKTFLKKLLRCLLIAYLVVLLLLTFIQRHLLYRPRVSDQLKVAEFSDIIRDFPESVDVEEQTAAGTTIRGWLLQKSADPAARRPLVIFFHGNAGNRAGRIGWYRLFSELNVDVVAMDYPGYGDSDGTMTESGLEETCEVAWQITSRQGWQPSEVIVAGASLGGAAAVHLTADLCREANAPMGLIAVATFSSMTDVASSLYPWLPVRAVLVDRYESDQKIKNVTCPITLLHGDQDELVRLEYGKKLFDAAPETSSSGQTARWVVMPEVTHRNILSAGSSMISDEFKAILSSTATALATP